MENINEQIRNKLSPIKNVIALIEKYENTLDGEQRRLIIGLILKSKYNLQQSVDRLIKIK